MVRRSSLVALSFQRVSLTFSSIQTVPVFAWGPGHELFRGHQNSIDIAFHMALALDLGRTSNVTYY
jgi:hypothetical protein